MDIQYKKGYGNTTEAAQHDISEVRALEEVDHSEGLSIAPNRLAQFKQCIAADPVMQQLIATIKSGWAINRKKCPPALTPYYNNRSELVEDNGLVFFGERLVVPTFLRNEMLHQIHRSHIGIEGCLRRAREVIYWPRMNAEVKDFVSKCSICQTHQPEQCREPLKSYAVPPRPWSVIGEDLFQLGQQQFLIIVDYWSGFFEVQELTKVTSKSVITASKVQFARHGIPDTLISDNGPQFASVEFAQFTREWQIQHRTSSPHYPQSNGRAENAVKTCKSLLKKAKASGEDPLLALLDWRNTPTEDMGTSPAQRLMGRRTRTLLPMHPSLLKAQGQDETKKKLKKRKAKQAMCYNKKCKPLEPLHSGDAIRMKLPGDTQWSLGSCVRALGDRSYEVEVSGRRYRRNRRHLRVTKESAPQPPSAGAEEFQYKSSEMTEEPVIPEESNETLEGSASRNSTRTSEDLDTAEDNAVLRRSTRVRRPPEWHNDYQL